MSLLLITHDLGIVRKISDRVCVMEKGSIVEQNKTKRNFQLTKTQIHKKTYQFKTSGEEKNKKKLK